MSKSIEYIIQQETESRDFFADKAKKAAEMNGGVWDDDALEILACAQISQNKINELKAQNV